MSFELSKDHEDFRAVVREFEAHGLRVGVLDPNGGFELLAIPPQPVILDHVQRRGVRRSENVHRRHAFERDRIDHQRIAVIVTDGFPILG